MAGPSNKDLMREIKRVAGLIEGDPKDLDDDGLKGYVKQNTEFRKSAQKFLWIIITAMMMGNIPILWFGTKLIAAQIKGQ